MQSKSAAVIVLLLIIALVLPVCASDAAVSDNAETVYFAADFNDGALPEKTAVTYGDGGLVYAENGTLNIAAADTYPPVTTVLFPYRMTGSEYVFECDVCFYRVTSEGSWFSLCFGAQTDSLLYQFTVKPDAAQSDSAALLYKSGEASWKTINHASVSDYISDKGLNKYKFMEGVFTLYTHYRLTVAVKNGTAFGYIDGVKVVEGRLNGSCSGLAGFNCRGVTVRIDDVRLHSVLPYSISAADSFGTEPDRPDTAVIAPPVVMQRDRQNPEIDTGASSVLFSVRYSDGGFRCSDGAVDLGSLDARLELYPDNVIPAFSVSDETTAAELSSYMSVNFINDAFITVSQTSLCKYFGNNRFVRIALDLSSRGGIDAAGVYRLLYKNGIRTVILSETAATPETVTDLRERMISVWVNCSPDRESVWNAAAAGAECIITADSKQAVELFESVKKPLLMRAPVVISDGGDTDRAPYCSETALIRAYNVGIRAIAVNVKSTKDGIPVLCKYEETEGMSEKLTVSETDLATLKELTYSDTRIGPDERILTLTELFELLSDSLGEAVLHISVNEEKTAKKVMELSEEYGVTEKCVIVSGEKSVINEVNASEAGMAASYSGGPYVFDKNDAAWSLSSICETLVGYNSVYRGSDEGMPSEFLSSVRLRGIPSYVTSASADPARLTLIGYDGFTGAAANASSKLVRRLDVSADPDGRLTVKVIYFDGSALDATALCEILTLSGSVKMTGGVISGEGVYAVLCPQTAQNGEKYYVCSSSVTAGGFAAAETESGGEPSSEDNGAVMIITTAAAGAAIVGGLIAFTAALRRKRKGSDFE